jgi:integrase
MFSLAVDWEWRPNNPVRGIERFDEVEREAWLQESQLEALAAALDSYPSQEAADALRILILTGSREGEVLNAMWEQFDLERRIWTKPSHHTKQKKTEHVPLNTAVLHVLKRMQKRRSGPYLFPGKDVPGKDGESARTTLKRPWMQVCKAAGLATAHRQPGKRRREIVRYKPNFRIHDLRHSFASHLVSRGQSLHVVGSLLGHTQPQTMKRYAHLSDSARRAAAEKIPWPSRFGLKKRTATA